MTLRISRDFVREEVIKKSRFICSLKRVSSEMEAESFIAEIKKVHRKANHNCSAFILGERQEIERASDDGEPARTAGIPMLEILKKRGLTDVCAVVTRYFGGIKLGAGGLIRAYAGSVAQALDEAGLVELIEQEELLLSLDYGLFDSLQHFLTEQQLTGEKAQFADRIQLSVFVDSAEAGNFAAALTEKFAGKIESRRLGKKLVERLIT